MPNGSAKSASPRGSPSGPDGGALDADAPKGGAADALPVPDAGPPGLGPGTLPLTEAEQTARAEFERAQRAYDLGRFETAIVHYSKAYEAMPLAPLLFNIAQCHRLLGEYAQAAFFYRRYLDLAGSPPNAALTRELLSEMEQRQSERERQGKDAAAKARQALAFDPSGAPDQGPVYKRWWFWAAIGAAVTAGATTVVVVSQPSPTTLGTLNAR